MTSLLYSDGVAAHREITSDAWSMSGIVRGESSVSKDNDHMVIHHKILQQEFWQVINGHIIKTALHRTQQDIFHGGDQSGLINKQ